MGACWKKMGTKCTSLNKIIKEIQDVVNVVTEIAQCKEDNAKPPEEVLAEPDINETTEKNK